MGVAALSADVRFDFDVTYCTVSYIQSINCSSVSIIVVGGEQAPVLGQA